MRGRSAFTLIEVVVALVIAGVIALLAYGTLQAGLDTRALQSEYHRRSESVATFRSLLTDALRHTADAPGVQPSFRLERSYAPNAAGARMQFYTRGISSPLGAGARWLVTVSVETDGLRFSAEPTEETNLGTISAVVPAVRSMFVTVAGDGGDDHWTDTWTSVRQIPRAVRLELMGENESLRSAPMVVQTSFEPAIK